MARARRQQEVHIPLGRAGWESFTLVGELDQVWSLAQQNSERIRSLSGRIGEVRGHAGLEEVRKELADIQRLAKRLDDILINQGAQFRKASDAYAIARNLTERLDAWEAKRCPA